MKWKAVLAASAAGSVTLACALFGGCSDDSSTGGGGEGLAGADFADVIYQAEATDEALVALVDAAPKDEPENAAVFDVPGETTLPATPIPTFSWHAGGESAGPVRSPHQWWTLPKGPHRTPSSRFASLLEGALSGVPSAYAHGTPVNGPAYFLVLSTASNDKLVRVFTLDTEYTPDADVWARVTGAGEAITATLLSAEFEANRVIQGGGPWQSAPITFTVE